MNPTRMLAAVTLAATAILVMHPALAQMSALQRTDLVRHDLDVPGRETLQTRVDFAPGALAPAHTHPGVEVAHVLEGTLEYRLDDGAPITLQAGQSLFIPAGTKHSARNVGSGKASELATYFVEKDKPLVVLAP